jgi:hemerythrin-like domain-containing protein
MTTTPATPRPQVMLAGQTAAPEGPVDLLMMYVVHHAFRRELTAVCEAVRDASVDDRARWEALLRRWDLFATFLHHHHSGEDEWVWPALLERADADQRTVLEAMEAEHADIDPALAACREGLELMGRTPSADARAALVVRVVATREALLRHLGHEETEALAILQQVMGPEEWAAIDQRFQRSFSMRELTWAVPWLLDGLPNDVLATVLAQPGAGVLKLVWRLSRRRDRRLARAAFGC